MKLSLSVILVRRRSPGDRISHFRPSRAEAARYSAGGALRGAAMVSCVTCHLRAPNHTARLSRPSPRDVAVAPSLNRDTLSTLGLAHVSAQGGSHCGQLRGARGRRDAAHARLGSKKDLPATADRARGNHR